MEEVRSEQVKIELPRYTCAECGLGVILYDGQVFRGCVHVDAPINAACSATCYGESKIDN